MRERELFPGDVYIRLADDHMGFLYRVRRFGFFGPRRFVAAFSKATNSAGIETPSGVPADLKQDHKHQGE